MSGLGILSKQNFASKKFQSKISLLQKSFGWRKFISKNNSWSKKIIWSQIFLSPKILDQKINFNQIFDKLFWDQNILSKQNFASNKFPSKRFLLQKSFSLKSENFRSKQILNQIFFWPKLFSDQNIFFRLNFFSGTN